MAWILAITGKGGVGKTTLAALAVRWLIEHGRGPVLAVDADPNSCLDAALGVRVRAGVGSVREEARRIAQAQTAAGPAGGIGKQELLEMKLQQAIVESDGFDLIAMGRPEGPGCYCYANNVLGAAVRKLAGDYPSVVLDNEAGLENLSRRIVTKVDYLVFVTDPSRRGITTARRLHDLAIEMGVDVPAMGVVFNRTRKGFILENQRDPFFAEVLGALPEDEELAEWDAAGQSLMELPATNAVYKAAAAILERMRR